MAEEAEKKARDAAKQAELSQPALPGTPSSLQQAQPVTPATPVAEGSVADIRMPKFTKWQKAAIALRAKTCVVVRQGMAVLSSPDHVCKQENSHE